MPIQAHHRDASRSAKIFVSSGNMACRVDYYFSIRSPSAWIGQRSFHDRVSAYDFKIFVDHEAPAVRRRSGVIELQRRRDKGGQKFHLQPAHWPFGSLVFGGEAFWGRDRLDPLDRSR